MPRVSAEGCGEQTIEVVLPSSLTVTGKIRPPPGLTEVDEAVKQDSEETHAEALQDLPGESMEIAEHSSASAGVKHGIDEPEPPGSTRATTIKRYVTVYRQWRLWLRKAREKPPRRSC